MSILLLIIGIVCLLVGLAGAVLPLPGPPLSFIGMLVLQYSQYIHFQKSTLFTFGIITIAVTFFDYYASILGTKKLGGSKYGMWGSTIGLCFGIFVIPAIGLFIGAFAGAFIGETLGGANKKVALNAAIGSFLGLVSGIFVKVVLCIAMIFACVWAIV
jgi:uncharacterized protein